MAKLTERFKQNQGAPFRNVLPAEKSKMEKAAERMKGDNEDVKLSDEEQCRQDLEEGLLNNVDYNSATVNLRKWKKELSKEQITEMLQNIFEMRMARGDSGHELKQTMSCVQNNGFKLDLNIDSFKMALRDGYKAVGYKSGLMEAESYLWTLTKELFKEIKLDEDDIYFLKKIAKDIKKNDEAKSAEAKARAEKRSKQEAQEKERASYNEWVEQERGGR